MDAEATEGNTEPKTPPEEPSGSEKKEEDNARFECNICLDTAKDAVVSLCGHLFCWPCLAQWLETRPNRQLCPVCKSAISKEKVVPIYGRGGETSDPREKVPPRPQGQRSEVPPPSFPGFQWGGAEGNGNVQFSFGIGIFPLSFFASWFQNPMERRPEAPPAGSRQSQEEQFLSNVFMYIGLFFLLWLIIV
ncbi:unnamed protein product [Caenorhabditis auriculariae]|uniref:RING-type E3 ubiquitin transferase n=1 Tax=Caenorhabditis auriculariae TaxID=2777116 RepID=A0A8S1GYE2_9PELO|nr:unnamed protein product [Caenorhabditis auriculariae]